MERIEVKELDTPEAFIMKHIARKVGLNIRPGQATFNSDTNEYVIPLKALVPSKVKLHNMEYKTFVYHFEDLGNAIVTKEDDKFKVLEFPRASDIDDKLHLKFSDLTSKMEKILLEVGQSKWGYLSYVEMFLRPLYNIINNILGHGFVYLSLIKQNNLEEYLQMLDRQGFVKFEDDVLVKSSNLLTIVNQKIVDETKRNDPYSVAKEIVGIVFSKEYEYIHKHMNNRVPTVYVDATKAYYLDAVRVGSPILMTTAQLLSNYRMLARTSRKSFNFSTIVGELVTAKLLAKDEEDSITADNEVFDKVLPLRKDLLKIAIEV